MSYTRPFVAFALVALAVFGAAHNSRLPPSDSLHTVAAAMARLEAKGFALQAITADERGDLHAGVYLTLERRDPASVRLLAADQRRLAEWEGVVLIKPVGTSSQVDPEEFARFGGHMARVGAVILFGDAELLARFAAALSD